MLLNWGKTFSLSQASLKAFDSSFEYFLESVRIEEGRRRTGLELRGFRWWFSMDGWRSNTAVSSQLRRWLKRTLGLLLGSTVHGGDLIGKNVTWSDLEVFRKDDHVFLYVKSATLLALFLLLDRRLWINWAFDSGSIRLRRPVFRLLPCECCCCGDLGTHQTLPIGRRRSQSGRAGISYESGKLEKKWLNFWGISLRFLDWLPPPERQFIFHTKEYLIQLITLSLKNHEHVTHK